MYKYYEINGTTAAGVDDGTRTLLGQIEEQKTKKGPRHKFTLSPSEIYYPSLTRQERHSIVSAKGTLQTMSEKGTLQCRRPLP